MVVIWELWLFSLLGNRFKNHEKMHGGIFGIFGMCKFEFTLKLPFTTMLGFILFILGATAVGLRVTIVELIF